MVSSHSRETLREYPIYTGLTSTPLSYGELAATFIYGGKSKYNKGGKDGIKVTKGERSTGKIRQGCRQRMSKLHTDQLLYRSDNLFLVVIP